MRKLINTLQTVTLVSLLMYGIAGTILTCSGSYLGTDHKTILVWFLVIFPVLVVLICALLIKNHDI